MYSVTLLYNNEANEPNSLKALSLDLKLKKFLLSFKSQIQLLI